MSTREWLVLWLLFAAYLFMGASIFYTIERQNEETEKTEAAATSEKVLQSVRSQLSSLGENATQVIDQIYQLCSSETERSSTVLRSGETESDEYKWTYYNSFFFTLTTLSTVGYGNLSPSTDEGKIIVIVYSIIGIPFTGIILAHMGDWFGSRLLRAHHRYKTHVYESRLTLVLDVLIYLVPGLAIFIIAPSFIFMYFEGWTFIDSIYYAFISLATIGYGDYVAGQEASEDEPWELVYKIFIILWLMFGLGYLVMILEFITRGMKSKRLNKIEKKLAHTIRQTHSRLWQEFIEDVNIVRKTLNENYIDEIKPVYKNKNRRFSEGRFLSKSAPELSEWPVPMSRQELEELKDGEENNDETIMGLRRRRAFSQIDDTLREQLGLPRRASDGAIHDIDITETFRRTPRPSIAPGDLRSADFIQLMGRRLSLRDPALFPQEGINLFTDDEILNSERRDFSTRSSGSWTEAKGPPKKRDRARSDAMFMRFGPVTLNYDQQKTWSGGEDLRKTAMVQNMKKAQSADTETGVLTQTKDSLTKPSPGSNLRRLSVAAMNFFSGDKKKNKDKSSKERQSPVSPGARSLNDDFDDEEDELNYITARGMRRASMMEILGTQPSVGRGPPLNPFLEQTSVADFIRAMATLRELQEKQMAAGEPLTEDPLGLSGAGNRQKSGGSRHPSLSYLFQPLPGQMRRPSQQSSSGAAGGLGQRRLSQAPSVRPSVGGFRKRAASIAPGDGPTKPSPAPVRSPKRCSSLKYSSSLPTIKEKK